MRPPKLVQLATPVLYQLCCTRNLCSGNTCDVSSPDVTLYGTKFYVSLTFSLSNLHILRTAVVYVKVIEKYRRVTYFFHAFVYRRLSFIVKTGFLF